MARSRQCSADERRVRLVVGPRALALDRVRPRRDLPLELHLRHEARLGEDHLDALARRLDVAEVDEAGLRRHPLAGERAAAGVVGDEAVVALVVHPRRRHPRVLVGEVARLRLGQRHLVPRVALVDRVAERVLRDERLLVRPVVEVRRAEHDPDRQVDLDEVGGDQLAAEDEARRDVPVAAPLGHRLVVVVDVVGVVEAAPAHEVGLAEADPLVPRQRLVEEVVEVVVHGHGALAVVHVPHEPHVVLRARLLGDVRAAAAGQDRRRVRVAPAEEARTSRACTARPGGSPGRSRR